MVKWKRCVYPEESTWIVRTGADERRTTFSATLPNKNRFNPDRPWVAIVISIALSVAAFSMIVSSALPFSTEHRTSVPANVVATFPR